MARLVGYNVLVAAALAIPIEIGLRIFGSDFIVTPPRIARASDPIQFEASLLVDQDLLWVPHRYANILATAADQHPSIAFMGDSCTYNGRYADELRWLVAARNPSPLSFVNLGVPGWSSWSGLQQLQRDVLPMRPKAITIYFGWNDHWEHFGLEDKDAARFLREPPWLRLVQLGERAVFGLRAALGSSVHRVPLADFRANLRQMVRIARDNDIIPILLTAPTSHRRGREPAYLARLGFLRDLDDLVPLHRRYVQAVQDVAAEEDAPLVDLYRSFNQMPRQELERLFKRDGIHLTPEGYRRIAALIDRHLLQTGLYARILPGNPPAGSSRSRQRDGGHHGHPRKGRPRAVIGGREERILEKLDSAQLVANGRFDVWLHGSDRSLYYVKDHCDGPEELFFVHVVPLDPNDLPDQRKENGFDNLDFDLRNARLDFRRRCVAVQPLPDYAVATVRTGQYNSTSFKRSWEVEFDPRAQ